MIEWLSVWTADILTKYAIHPNGRTSYKMYSQHACKHMVLGFGEKVNFQFKVKPSERDALGNSKSGVGYFVGIVNNAATNPFAHTALPTALPSAHAEKGQHPKRALALLQYM